MADITWLDKDTNKLIDMAFGAEVASVEDNDKQGSSLDDRE